MQKPLLSSLQENCGTAAAGHKITSVTARSLEIAVRGHGWEALQKRRMATAEKEPHMPPTLKNGKICYIEMPAKDIAVSSKFYQQVFSWNVRTRGNGSVAFDDTTGQVSGSWVLNRPPLDKPGLLLYIM